MRVPRRSRTSLASACALTLALASLALVALSGCGNRGAPPIIVPTEGTSTPSPTGPAQTSVVPLSRVALSLDRAWTGLDLPLLVTHAADGSGRVFIVEKTGRIRVARDGALKRSAYLDLSAKVSGGGEQGLLGLAFAPAYSKNGHFYVNYTDSSGATNVVRYTVPDPAADTARITETQVVLRVAQPYANHNGGCIAFGPDGYLYIGMGDGGAGGDPENRAQDPGVLLGKMLRIDVGEAAWMSSYPPKTYRIPSDNPFVAEEHASRGYRPEIWALGLRNPWRFSFDRETGDLWIGDVGQNAWEEIDFAPAGVGGQNFGWNLLEGTHPYPVDAGAPPNLSRFTMPAVEYPHPTGQSVTGGFVYRGSASPVLRGVYLYADYSTGKVWGFSAGDKASENVELADTSYGISSFGEDEQGELYVCDINGGAVYRVSAREK